MLNINNLNICLLLKWNTVFENGSVFWDDENTENKNDCGGTLTSGDSDTE